MLLIDAHAHLTFKSFRKDLSEVIKRAKNAGVVTVIDSAINPKDFMKAMELKRNYGDFIQIAIGAAPQTLTKEKFDETLEIIEKNNKIAVAIGEIGLDYYWVKDEESREFTRKAFRELIRIAINFDKPIVIHNREALDDVIKILKEERAEFVVFHAFMGSLKDAKKILENGWFLSIPTIIYRLTGLQNIVKKLPLDVILLETDSPFLSPIPKTRNEPANLKYSVEIIAKLKGVAPEKIGEITTVNAKNFFRLDFVKV